MYHLERVCVSNQTWLWGDTTKPIKAFQPLTQDQALQDDGPAMASGLFRLTGTQDVSGRSIVILDHSMRPKCGKDGVALESTLQCGLYMAHKVMEDITTQQKSVVFLVLTQNCTTLWNADRRVESMTVESMIGVFPIRVSAVHICQPPAIFRVFWPIFKVLLGPSIFKRVRIHLGTTTKVLASLGECGLTPDVLPSELGGHVILDHDVWLKENRKLENEGSEQSDEEDESTRVVVRLTPIRSPYPDEKARQRL